MVTKMISALTAAVIMLFTLSAFQTVPEQNNTMSGETENMQNGENGNAERSNTTEIKMLFGETEITAVLDDSETSKAFMKLLPMTLDMRRYADREYYAALGELPEEGENIPDFENGDVTYYTAGRSLAIFFGNEENSNQDGLIRMGRITSDLGLFTDMGNSVTVTIKLAESEESVRNFDFSVFTNVEITGIDIDTLNRDELEVLYTQARYCQAMTDADIETMREIVSEDMIFTHMSGKQQTREQYFADIAAGRLKYFMIGIENPQISVDNDNAEITFTSVLNANAYGARGTFRMKGTHHYEKRHGEWIAVNGLK